MDYCASGMLMLMMPNTAIRNQVRAWTGNEQRHIWIFNHYAISPDLPGGTRHYHLGHELVQQGYDVTIFASNWNHKQKRMHRLQDGQAWAIETINGVRFIWLWTYPHSKNDWRRILNMLSYAVHALLMGLKRPKGIHKPDIIIGSSVHPLAVIVGRLLAWYYQAHFITEVRDLWPQSLIDLGSLSATSLLARLMRRGEFFLYRHSDLIITLLPLAHEYICKEGIPREKVVWIPNGVDLRLYSPVIEMKKKNGTFRIFYTGNHGNLDDLEAILNAAMELQARGISSIRFVLVGDGIDKKRLMNISKMLNLSNVEFRDPVPKKYLPDLLIEADACILVNKDLPIYKYGISANKLFDYLAAGKPVIMVGGDIAGNIVEEAGCGITVKPDDTEALAKACLDLYHMSAEDLHDMGMHGRRHVEKYYGFEFLANRLAEHIGEISSTR